MIGMKLLVNWHGTAHHDHTFKKWFMHVYIFVIFIWINGKQKKKTKFDKKKRIA